MKTQTARTKKPIAAALAIFATLAATLTAALAPAPLLSAQDSKGPGGTPTVVTPMVYVSLDQVPRGKTVDVALTMNIAAGYHVNSHVPSQSYLIATNATLADTSGFTPAGSSYPAGQSIKFAFSQEKLSVYSVTATLWLRYQAQNDAPLGEITLPIVLKYQACNATACLPPTKLAVPVHISIATADAKTRPMHQDIFKTEPKLTTE